MNYTNRTGKQVSRSAWVAIAAAAFTLIGGTTQAAESVDAPPQKVVSYKDLDLSSSKDVAVLYRRIQGAAVAVCGDYDIREQMFRPAVRACINHATSEAVAAVHSPLLTSLYNAKTGKTEKVASIAR
jgi:UrcA family protein